MARLRAACERRPRLLERVFTSGERAEASARGRARWERLAGAFAAKEAARKALGGARGVRLRDVEVAHDPAGRPLLVLHASAGDAARAAGATRWHVSITHAAGLAVATVVAEGSGAAGPGAAGRGEGA